MVNFKNWTNQNGILGMEPNLEARREYASQYINPTEILQANRSYQNKDYKQVQTSSSRENNLDFTFSA